ncbi:MAG: hypothetical protein AAB065_03540, partial [Deltaproteobacteria bacterium]
MMGMIYCSPFALTCPLGYSNIPYEDNPMNDRLRLFFRRRNKLINPRYQVKVALAAAVSLFAYSIIFGALIFYPL